MRIAEPDALALDYTRCMMGFLLFHPEPRQALMIGLGGGSLAKFFHRRLRATRLRVVELDARIVAAARAHFALPANDARLAVEIGDGAARSEEHTSELQSRVDLVCRLLLEKKK